MKNCIKLLSGREGPSRLLMRHSALAGCAAHDSHGVPAVVVFSPSLSTGERLLWNVLAFVNDQGPRPSDEALRACLDEANLNIAQAAIAEVEAVSA